MKDDAMQRDATRRDSLTVAERVEDDGDYTEKSREAENVLCNGVESTNPLTIQTRRGRQRDATRLPDTPLHIRLHPIFPFGIPR
jgi:hypothetical protein